MAGEVHVPLRRGAVSAVACTVGGALVRLEDADGPLLAPPPEPACRPEEYRGAVLAPWPGRTPPAYEFDGARHVLDVTDPSTGTAIHGLLAQRPWEVVERGPAVVAMATTLGTEPGYPFAVAVEVRYALADDGVDARVAATNRGDRPAPVGLGVHPYLTAGAALEDTVLKVPAAAVLLPQGEGAAGPGPTPVEGTDLDLREGRRLAGRRLDHAFTGLARDAAGDAHVVLRAGGREVALTAGREAAWVMAYTSDTLRPPSRRSGVAVEPMTCPPGALATGEGLAVLAPGGRLALTWRLRARGGQSATSAWSR
jgi:aldose 1-epimerase